MAPNDLANEHEWIRAASKRPLPAYCGECDAKEGATKVCIDCDYEMRRELEVYIDSLAFYGACARRTQPPLPPPQKQRTSCGGTVPTSRKVARKAPGACIRTPAQAWVSLQPPPPPPQQPEAPMFEKDRERQHAVRITVNDTTTVAVGAVNPIPDAPLMPLALAESVLSPNWYAGPKIKNEKWAGNLREWVVKKGVTMESYTTGTVRPGYTSLLPESKVVDVTASTFPVLALQPYLTLLLTTQTHRTHCVLCPCTHVGLARLEASMGSVRYRGIARAIDTKESPADRQSVSGAALCTGSYKSWQALKAHIDDRAGRSIDEDEGDARDMYDILIHREMRQLCAGIDNREGWIHNLVDKFNAMQRRWFRLKVFAWAVGRLRLIKKYIDTRQPDDTPEYLAHAAIAFAPGGVGYLATLSQYTDAEHQNLASSSR